MITLLKCVGGGIPALLPGNVRLSDTASSDFDRGSGGELNRLLSLNLTRDDSMLASLSLIALLAGT